MLFYQKMGVTYTVLDPSDVQSLQTVFETKDVTMYFSECPTNPLIRVVDVPTVVALCRECEFNLLKQMVMGHGDGGEDLIFHLSKWTGGDWCE